jgi:hypothetical protein
VTVGKFDERQNLGIPEGQKAPMGKVAPGQKMVPILFSLFIIFLLRQNFNYTFYFTSIFRVIYVPIYFWLSYFVYILGTYFIFLRDRINLGYYLKRGIIAAYLLHLYFLLGDLIIKLSTSQGILPTLYFCYIKSIFLIATCIGIYVCLRKKGEYLTETQKEINLFFYQPFLVTAVFFLFYQLFLNKLLFGALFFISIIIGKVLSQLNFGYFYKRLKSFSAKDINIFILFFALAFIIRVIFSITLVYKTTIGPQGIDGFLYASDDGLTYDQTARNILEDPSILTEGKVQIWGQFDQFYSIVLAGIYKLFNRNFYTLTIFQSILGAFIPPMIFLIGRVLFSRTVGFISALFLCFKGGLLLTNSYMGHEAIWLPLLILLALLLTNLFNNPVTSKIIYHIIIGINLAFLSLFRSIYFYFFPFLCLWEILFLKKGYVIKTKIVHLAIAGIATYVVIFGILKMFNNDVSFIAGNTHRSSRMQNIWNVAPRPPFQHVGNKKLMEFGINPFKDLKGSLARVANRPFDFFILMLKIYPLRIVAYLESYQFGLFDPIYMINPAKIKNRFASTLEFYFTMFFLIGLISCFLRKQPLNSPIFLILSYHIILFSIIFSLSVPRYKEISSPMIYLIGSYGFIKILRFLK